MTGFTDYDVPSEVRARITDTVHRGMAEPARRGLRMPLAVAAGVAVLAVSGVVAAVAVQHRPEQVPGGPSPVPGTSSSAPAPAVSSAADEMDRCWQAVVTKGKQDLFPPRSKWASVQWQPSPSGNAIALRADGRTFFCMTTNATVLVSDPNAKGTSVAGTGIRVMVADDTGWVLGTAPATLPDITIDSMRGFGQGGALDGGVFLVQIPAGPHLASVAKVRVGLNRWKIPSVPALAVQVTDRELPPPERKSEDGKRLGQCLEKAGWPRYYADQWQPGLTAEDGEWYMAVAFSGGQFGRCVHVKGVGEDISPDHDYRFIPLDAPVEGGARPQYLAEDSAIFHTPAGAKRFVMGTVAAAARSMTVRTGHGDAYPATVRGGVWTAVVPAETPPSAVTVKDADGKVLYDGALVVVGG